MRISDTSKNSSFSNEDRKNHESGTHACFIYSITDMGTISYQWKGETISARKMLITFAYMNDGQQMYLRKEYTISLHEKSNLRKDLQSIRGKKFTDEELGGFDIDMMLNQPLLITIEMETAANGKDYPKIISMGPLPKGMPIVPLELKGFIFSWDGLDKIDQIAFLSDEDNRIPKYIKEKMLTTPEYTKWNVDPFATKKPVKTLDPNDFSELGF